MSQLNIEGAITRLPTNSATGAAGYTNITVNAAGETCVFGGYVCLENPLGGSKTISGAGSGKIVWKAGTTTFANGTTKFRVGIQDLSATTAPMQGDATWDVYVEYTGGGGGVATGTNTSTMTTGTKTIAHGDLIGIVFSMTAVGGADSVQITTNQTQNNGVLMSAGYPGVTENTGGTYTRSATSLPNAYIVFDDGTVGWFFGSGFYSSNPTITTYNSGTATADEYGNFIQYPFTFNALGLQFVGQIDTSSSDAELLLYSDPLGTPVVQRTITLDATKIPATATITNYFFLFSSPFLLKANTPYGISLRPTTTNGVSPYYRDTTSAGTNTVDIGVYNYAIRRLDNTGAFSDYNGGTAKTRQMTIGIIGTHIEQGVNICSGQVGVY